MALVKDEILVIKGTNYSEADKILTVFSKNRGKFSIIAKGVRKIESKNRASIQTLCTSSVTYYEGRNLGVLVEATLLNVPEFDRDQLAISGKLIVIVNNLLPEDEKDQILFSRLQELIYGPLTLRDVNKFRVWLLDHLGYLPDLHHCMTCSKRENLKFIDLFRMVMVCEDCYQEQIDSSSFVPVDDVKYEALQMDEAIDNFVLRVLEG